MTMCDCPADWVACFRRDCSRGAAIREQQRQWYEKYRTQVGDIMQAVVAHAEHMDRKGD